MKRTQANNIAKGIVKWVCDGCKGIIANPYPKAQDSDKAEFQLGKTKTKKCKLKIIQWNAESFMSKEEEFRGFILRNDIDIFMIQETKVIPKDRQPKIEGYEIRRRNREQVKGKERNRGGACSLE